MATNIPAADQSKKSTPDDIKLAQVTTDFLNFQNTLNNDQVLQYIKLYQSVPFGTHPSSDKDVDILTTFFWENLPIKWPVDLKKKLKDMLNSTRLSFKLRALSDTNWTLIIIIILLLILSGAAAFYFLKK